MDRPEPSVGGGWHQIETAEERENHQRFRHGAWERARLAQILRLRPGSRVVEVGCGGGYFTRVLSPS